jgi:hypothetical protein
MGAHSAVAGASTGAKEASPTFAGDRGLLAFTSQPGAVTELYTLDYFAGSTVAVHADALDDGTDQLAPRWNADGSRLYWTRGTTLLSATYSNGAFGTPKPEAGLAGTVVGVTISNNELELIYGDSVDPTMSKLNDATRASLTAPWVSQGPLTGLINSGMGESAPTLTHDQFSLYWVSHRDGTPTLYTAVRQTITAAFAQVESSEDLPQGATDPDLSAHDTVFAYTANNDIMIDTRTCM